VTVRALVTGGNGFVAQWAIRAMLERRWQVTAAGIGERPEFPVLSAEEAAQVQWTTTDVTRQAEIADVLAQACPEVVLHLAAVSHVPDAMHNPGYAYEVNAVGTVRLLAEVRQLRDSQKIDPAVLIVGSAEQYGRHDLSEMPLHEDMEQRPLTLYAASKVAQEVAAIQSWRSDGLRIVCTRSFNHSGVGHAGRFLLPGLVAQAVGLPATGGTLRIGNGDTVRDFLHVSDVVDAYLSLMESGTAGEVYNVSSGQGSTVRELAAAVLQRLGVSADIATDPARARSVDVPVLVGSNQKLRRATGWAPRKTRDDIIDDLIHAATR
jgi:GDP-4-dehydro-6-deoxy-D-mannose reductase